jgi:hypothetical protein
MKELASGDNLSALSKSAGRDGKAVKSALGVTPMIMGHVGKISTQQNMDSKGLSNLLGDQSKMAMQSSPDAANLAKQLLTAQEGSGGIMGMLKKLLGS